MLFAFWVINLTYHAISQLHNTKTVLVMSHSSCLRGSCRYRYTVASLDMTVYPADANLVKNAFQVLGNVAAMSPNNLGFIMLPVYQKQTTDVARIEHRRTIEDFVMKHSLSFGQEVAILYSRPETSVRDGRGLSQVALLVLSNSYPQSPWSESDAFQTARVGPFPLIRVADMLGYDETTRPSASARVEQNFGCREDRFFWSMTEPHVP